MRRYQTVTRWSDDSRSTAYAVQRRRDDAEFTRTCRAALQAAGFAVDMGKQFFADAGVEVDLIATNRQGISFYITCRGTEQGARPGVARPSAARAYKKAIGRASALHAQGWGPSLLLTTFAPDTERSRALLAEVNPEVLFDVVNPLTDIYRLRWLARADERQLAADLDRRRKPSGQRRNNRTLMTQM